LAALAAFLALRASAVPSRATDDTNNTVIRMDSPGAVCFARPQERRGRDRSHEKIIATVPHRPAPGGMKLHVALLGLALTRTAAADPTTQACLGDLDKLLACPAGSTRHGTECRAQSTHWSGSSRQGPAVFLRDSGKVSFAANYKDHMKSGRVFRFDSEGRLESWADVAADQDHGLSVTCTPEGRAAYVASYAHGTSVGTSRSWNHRDGSFSYAMTYDAQGHAHSATLGLEQTRRPDELCHPRVCDVTAAPDLSDVPPAK
jgi:hypothetical protein